MGTNTILCNSTGNTTEIDYSNFPTAQIGNAVLYKNDNCWQITEPSIIGAGLADALYNDCYDCYVQNNGYIAAEFCSDPGFPGPILFSITDLGFVPQVGEVYYVSFVSPYFNGVFKTCLTLGNINLNIDNKPLPPFSSIVDINTTAYTDCQFCIEGNQQVYKVIRCDISRQEDFILLLDDSYNDHIITYTDLSGINRYCGYVIGRKDPVPITGVFISDYSPNNEGACNQCNDSVNTKRVVTNCLDGTTEVIWNSPYFTDGDFSHLSTNYGCYELGPITTDPVTISDFILNFDPQPSCQDCIQCNGIILYLTVDCPSTPESETYIVLSYQYAEVGDIIWDPYKGGCATVLGVGIDTNLDYSYTFYSFLNLGSVDCTTCQSLETPIITTTYVASDCISGSEAAITFSGSTITFGDIVKTKWGTSDFLCYQIIEPYFSGEDGFVHFYSDTTTSFDSCTGCTANSQIGVTLVNCNTYVEKYVNVDAQTWVTMTGYDDNLGSHVVKGSDGQCYYLINSCPISPNYETFTTNEYYYLCAQCIPNDENSSCKCYYGIGASESVVSGSYVDCEGEIKTFYSNKGFVKFCGNLIDGNNIYYSGNACEDNRCQDFCCGCYKITNNKSSLLYVRYLDCDNSFVDIQITGNTTTTFCALNVQYLDSLGNFSPKVPTGVISITDTCVNGKCYSDLTLGQQLLYDYLQSKRPCPNTCCGKTTQFGAYLLRNNGNTPGTYSIR